MDYIIVNGELYHHGIKGMKWGRRRFQNKDGSLTPAGKERYDDDSGAPKKSKHRLKLEEKYRQKGMSQETAEMAAARRIKTEKILAVAAGVTVAAAATYVVSKHVKERADGIIKSGTKMQVIAANPDKNLDRAFYTAYKDADMTKYKGMYGQQIKDQAKAFGRGEANVHKIMLKADQDVKVVSRKKAADAFAELYKNDPEFRDNFKKSNEVFRNAFELDLDGKKTRLHNIAAGKMTDKQLVREGYDAFNRGLVNHTPEGNSVAKKFYDKLKSMGYDAVADINDQKYSGYNAKKPVIVFNRANKISISEVKKMTDEQIASNADRATKSLVGKALVESGAQNAALIVGGALGLNTVRTVQINNYRVEHPNTRLSDKEILNALGLAYSQKR